MGRNEAHNEKGMSILEVTIAFGLLMLLSLAITSMITHQNEQTQSFKEKSNFIDISNKVRANAASETSVLNSMTVSD